MKCLVCDNDIRIDTLRQLFSVQPLRLCGRCSENLRPKSTEILFEDNEWMRSVIDKLNQGDIILIQLFKSHLEKALIKIGGVHSKVKIIESKEDLPYPWLEILLESILKHPREGKSTASTDEIIIAIERKENVNAHISFFK